MYIFEYIKSFIKIFIKLISKISYVKTVCYFWDALNNTKKGNYGLRSVYNRWWCEWLWDCA